MTLVAQSLVLSLPVLFRFIFTLPVIAAFAFAVTYGAILISPLIAVLLLIFITTFAGLVGIRAGLAARGAHTPLDLILLIMASLKYGLLQIMVTVVIFALFGAILLGAGLTSYEALRLALAGDSLEIWTELISADPMITWVALGCFVTLQAFTASIAVPMAASAHATTGARADIFQGFGAGFSGLFVISALVTGASLMTPVGASVSGLSDHAFYLLASSTAGNHPEFALDEDQMIMVGWAIFGLWLYCWLYAASAIAFLNYHDRTEKDRTTRWAAPKSDPDQIRNLRLAREQSFNQGDLREE